MNTPYDEGKAAYSEGKSIKDNPYDTAAYNWLLGYLSADLSAENAKTQEIRKG